MAIDFGTKKSESIVQTVYESFEELTNTVFIGTKKGKIKSFYKICVEFINIVGGYNYIIKI